MKRAYHNIKFTKCQQQGHNKCTCKLPPPPPLQLPTKTHSQATAPHGLQPQSSQHVPSHTQMVVSQGS